jgi:uncharacterized membrane protein YfcA
VAIETGLLLLAVAGTLAYMVRGIVGGASAIFFNALFGLGVSLGLAGELTLRDGLYWVAIGDLVAGTVLLVTLRAEIRFEPFIVRFLVVSLPINILFTLLLTRIDLGMLTIGLGFVLLGAGAYLAVRRRLHTWDERTLLARAVPAGAAAGVLGGLYGMPGPVTVVYLAHAGSEPGRFRARLTLLSVFWGAFRVSTLVLTGSIGARSAGLFALTLPFVLGGLWLGYRIHPRIGARQFRVGLGGLVGLAGAFIIIRALAPG